MEETMVSDQSKTLQDPPPIRWPRPERVPRPAGSAAGVPAPLLDALKVEIAFDVEGVRRELQALADRCRAFAGVLDETSRRLGCAVSSASNHPRAHAGHARTQAVPRDTLPEPCVFDTQEATPGQPAAATSERERDEADRATLVRIAPEDLTAKWVRPVSDCAGT